MKEQYITVAVKQNGVIIQRLKLRRITFKTEEGKVYVFVTNNFTLPAPQVATIYKNRWMIELLFKQIKQNFPLRYFWGESSNAIKMQVYCVLIAQLLMVIPEKSSHKEIFCQYDYCDTAASDELCGIAGVHKRYIQSLEKHTQCLLRFCNIKIRGTTPKIETMIF